MAANVNQVLFAKALADETRQEIMTHLCCVWLSVNDLVEKMDGKVNQPTVSHHLKKLEEANLVYVREEGRFRYYTLNQEQFTVCCGMLVRNFAPNYAEKGTCDAQDVYGLQPADPAQPADGDHRAAGGDGDVRAG